MSQNSQVVSWGCCELGLKDNQYVICTQCKKAYHMACITCEVKNASFWKCTLCVNAKSKGKNDNTPVRITSSENSQRAEKRIATSPPQHVVPSPLTQDDVRDIIKSEMSTLLARIDGTITSVITRELTSIKCDISELKDSITFLGNQYEDIMQKSKDNCIEIKKLREDNDSLRATVTDLCHKYNQMEQLNRTSNLEIQCVPESKTENLVNMVLQLCTSVSCATIKDDHILKCTRVAKMNTTSPRPRSIIVQLSSTRLRDSLLAAVIKYNKTHPDNKLHSAHLGLKGEKIPVFVTEHLSSHNKALHAAARVASKEKGFKYVWVRNGRVYMRKTDESDFKYIRNMDCIEKLV